MADPDAQAKKAAGKGALAAGLFLKSQIQRKLSVAAPRVKIKPKVGQKLQAVRYRATEPATPGAPPRKLSGRLRAGHAVVPLPGTGGVRVGTNVIYAPNLEFVQNHAYMLPTLMENEARLIKIIGEEMMRGGPTGD